jgi:hypothetical protein
MAVDETRLISLVSPTDGTHIILVYPNNRLVITLMRTLISFKYQQWILFYGQTQVGSITTWMSRIQSENNPAIARNPIGGDR